MKIIKLKSLFAPKIKNKKIKESFRRLSQSVKYGALYVLVLVLVVDGKCGQDLQNNQTPTTG